MISINDGALTPQTGLTGYAPASPQSARGENANEGAPTQEVIAASQANATLYDQQVNLQDRTVAARTAAVELASRLQPHDMNDDNDLDKGLSGASALSNGHKSDGEGGENIRAVESSAEAARDTDRDATDRALAAYAAHSRPSPESQVLGSV